MVAGGRRWGYECGELVYAAGSVGPVVVGLLAAALPKLMTYDADTEAHTAADAQRRRARKDAAAAEAAG